MITDYNVLGFKDTQNTRFFLCCLCLQATRKIENKLAFPNNQKVKMKKVNETWKYAKKKVENFQKAQIIIIMHVQQLSENCLKAKFVPCLYAHIFLFMS